MNETKKTKVGSWEFHVTTRTPLSKRKYRLFWWCVSHSRRWDKYDLMLFRIHFQLIRFRTLWGYKQWQLKK